MFEVRYYRLRLDLLLGVVREDYKMDRKIPKGYKKVTSGKVRSSDLCNGDDKQWKHPTKRDWEILGSDVNNYYFVVRKISA